MGNLQSDGSKQRGLMKLKRSPRKDAGKHTNQEIKKGKKSGEVTKPCGGGSVDPDVPRYLVTDSWRVIEKLQSGEELRTPSKESSSGESVFTDPTGNCQHEIASKEDDDTLIMDAIQLGDLTHSTTTTPPGDMTDNKTMKEVQGTKFTIVRHRKVDLAPSRISDQCLTEILSGNQNNNDQRRHSSLSDSPLESNVLRKVASLTLDRATLDQKVSRPKFVPEKLDFQLYEKFEGQMLVNWLFSSYSNERYLKNVLQPSDWKTIIIQFCTHLLAAGVLRQLPDKDAPTETVFRPDLMYFWTHTEAVSAAPPTPGRLSTISWPPAAGEESVVKLNGKSSIDDLSQKTELELELIALNRKLQDQSEIINNLQDTIDRLNQEHEKSQMLADIQTPNQ